MAGDYATAAQKVCVQMLCLVPAAAKDWTQQYATSDTSYHSLRSMCWTKQPYGTFWNKLPDLDRPEFPHVVADSASDNIPVQPVADSGHKFLGRCSRCAWCHDIKFQAKNEYAAITNDSL